MSVNRFALIFCGAILIMLLAAAAPSVADSAPPAQPAPAQPAAPPTPTLNPSTSVDNGIKTSSDIAYTSDNDYYRSLNVYQPATQPKIAPPLMVLIHGGGWGAGDKKDFWWTAQEFVRRGYVAASLSYRLTGLKGMPIPIYDCKSAIRFLRAHAAEYGFNPNIIIVGGHSAGGHLAEFLAASNGVKNFDQGEYLNVSSDVQAAYPMAGIANLIAYVSHGAAQGPDAAKWENASPVHWISKMSAPMFICHGGDDNLVPLSQPNELKAALDKAGIPNVLTIFPGEKHGSGKFMAPAMLNQFDAFLAANVRMASKSIMQAPVGKGAYKMINVSVPNLVLDAASSGKADGTKVNLDTPTGAANQKWLFDDKGDGVYAIHPSYDKTLSIAVENGASANQTNVILEKDEGKPSERWMLIHNTVGDVFFFIPQCAPSTGLEDFGGRTAPGSQTDIYAYQSGDKHQQWRLSAW